MILLDVNVVVAAFRADHTHHARVRPWLDGALAASARFAVPDLVWVGFIRVCTNPRIFPVPASLDEASDFVRAVTRQPGYLHLGGLRDGIEAFLDLATASTAPANLAVDSYIAALALSWDAAVVSLDRDFRRFDGLRVIEPAPPV